ncbi:MAG TPA: hypothetical protein VFW09_11390 [Solirubrobacteraceae bacterium]|jgi:hypothetical protein|nr:hypothetical protein [Solirubrobacteraceae bacterium]
MLHVWLVDPQNADRHLELLRGLFDAISDQPGFVSARILESPSRSSIAAIIEMRTREDRQRLERLPQVHHVLHQLHDAANLIARLYDRVAEFDARESAAGVE